MTRRSTVSLFSGCGGFDIGFSRGGFRVVEAHDIDPVATATYNNNHKPVARLTDLRTPHALQSEDADVVIAGPPCQGFSTIGSLRHDDERNSLFRLACKIAVRLHPRLFILENVMGLTNSRNKLLLKAAIDYVSGKGYFVETLSIKGEQLGLAQRRRRTLVIARSGKRPFQVTLEPKSEVTVREAFRKIEETLQSQPVLLPENSKARLIAEKIGPGQKLCNVRESPAAVHTWDIPEVFGPVTKPERRLLTTLLRLRRSCRERAFGDADPVSLQRLNRTLGCDVRGLLQTLRQKGYVRRVGNKYDLTHTFNGSYRRLKWDAPSPTVDTHFGDPRLFLHPAEHRGLSVIEAATLQGFTPTFLWPESNWAAFRLIGNAVPPPISEAIAGVAHGLIR